MLIYIFLIVLLIIILSISIYLSITSITENDIINLTDNWCYQVTVNHDSTAIANLFCKNGNLIGTVSQVKRKGDDIKRYFDYFANKPGLQILSKKYNISKVTSNVFINSAFVTWTWDGLEQPITARMTFIFKNKCIFQLHSSILPELNQSLLNISEKN